MDSRTFFYEFGKELYAIDGLYEDYARSKNVKGNLLWALYALNDGKKHSQIQIAKDWEMPKTTVNTLVLELFNKGYLIMEQIPGEKRQMSICLNAEGEKFADSALKDLYALEKRVYESLPFSQKDFIQNLKKMKQTLMQEGISGGKEK